MSFIDLNKEMVSNFLHSAVLIDDQIKWSSNQENGEAETLEIEETAINEPDEFDVLEEYREEDAEPQSSELYAKPIIKSFSGHGIVCSPYTWGSEDDEFPNSSEKADLLILDWKLEKGADEKGTYAKNFIVARIEKDVRNKERLRFISIYTSEKTTDVLSCLETALQTISGITVIGESSYLDVVSKHGHKICRINVISKRTTPEEDLADKLIEEFTEFVKGFLPNILLSSVAEIRNKTYEYLAHYHDGLDEAVITHYTALKSQRDTFDTAEMQFREYVSNLVASSIQNSLHFSGYVKTASSEKAILDYLDAHEALVICSKKKTCNDKIKIFNILKNKTYEGLKEAAQIALNFDMTSKSGKEKWDDFKSGRSPLSIKNPDEKFHLEFSALDLLKRAHPQLDGSPVLRLGSILKHKTKDVFYLCIQPLCDGVRLIDPEKEYPFPFLKLQEVKSGDFNFVIPFEGKYKKFKCEMKTRNIVSLRFMAHKEKKDVRGRRYGNSPYHFFKSSKKGDTFIWLAELKDIYAQETLNQLAHQGSRVGSDKFEWLRKQS